MLPLVRRQNKEVWMTNIKESSAGQFDTRLLAGRVTTLVLISILISNN